MRLNFDIETNGFLSREDLIVHCVSVIDLDSCREWTFANKNYRVPADGSIEDCLKLLEKATEISGHNIKGFDLPVLERLYGWEPPEQVDIYDTYIAAQVLVPDVKDRDMRVRNRVKRLGQTPMPGNLIGSHMLEAWGYRLGIHKGSYGKQRTDWDVFDMDMLMYCVQDVRVCVALRLFLGGKTYSDMLRDVEQEFAVIMSLQQTRGFHFNVDRAQELVAKFMTERAEIADKLQELFPPEVKVTYTKVKKIRKEETVPFNPASRQQIVSRLEGKYDWKPEKYTKAGNAIIDEKVLENLGFPETNMLARYLMLEKRIGQLATGKQGWLKKVGEDGRIHGRVVNVGTPHGRCGHSSPNVAQTPSLKVEYGAECRSLFSATPGNWVMVGADASGIQLRALSHYLAPYDGGKYVKIVTEADPHEANRVAAGIKTRDGAKTFIYAYLFGAGPKLLGAAVEPDTQGEAAIRKAGDKAMRNFAKRTVGLQDLKDGLEGVYNERGFLRSLMGRPVPLPTSRHALNYILTSFEADVMKLATVLLHREAPNRGLIFGENYANLAHVHDEFQFEVVPELADTLGKLAVECIREAGVILKSRCPLDGEYKIGPDWSKTH